MRFANGILLFVTFIASVTLLVMMQRRRLIRRLGVLVFWILRLQTTSSVSYPVGDVAAEVPG